MGTAAKMPCLTAEVASIRVKRNVIVTDIDLCDLRPPVMIIKFIMFLLKQSKLLAVISFVCAISFFTSVQLYSHVVIRHV